MQATDMDDVVPNAGWQYELSPYRQQGARIVYISRDGTTLVDVQKHPMGARSLHSGIMRLALFVNHRPEIKRACLLLVGLRLSRQRLLREWQAVRSVLTSDIARRLSLAVIDREGIWTEPEDEYLHRIAEAWGPVGASRIDSTETIVKPVAGQKFFEVAKVLLCRWLRREGAIPIGRLAEQVGCTYPTATLALRRLERKRSIVRHTNRSVELSRFPKQTWSELVALSGRMRRSLRYVDVSGEKTDPQRLLNRLNRLKPAGVALGGVEAARRWHSDFDLHGTPRLDLVLHAPQGRMDLGFMRQLDPALKRTDNESQFAVIVVHPLLRANPLFEGEAGASLPFADPIETVLDLHELGLMVQAGQLLGHLRPETRLP
jgi:hypothetical protein